MTDIPDSVIACIRLNALYGVSTGRAHIRPIEAAYLRRCTHFHWQTGALVLFTKDTGHHSSGWLKNPDYERCFHLSLSFRELHPARPASELANVARLAELMTATGTHVPPAHYDERLAERWARAVLGDDLRFAWIESAKSREGIVLGVRHYRVFCDLGWKPILPRGEVYSRELTERGWRSFSDLGAERPSHVDAE